MANRIRPGLPVHMMRTFQIAQPINSHYRLATCEEVGCIPHAKGWRTTADELTELGQMQAHYIRTECGKRFTEERNEAGLTVFTFEPGQKCFMAHQVSLDRPAFFIVRDGDWRGNPTGRSHVHTDPSHWAEELQETTSKIEGI